MKSYKLFLVLLFLGISVLFVSASAFANVVIFEDDMEGHPTDTLLVVLAPPIGESYTASLPYGRVVDGTFPNVPLGMSFRPGQFVYRSLLDQANYFDNLNFTAADTAATAGEVLKISMAVNVQSGMSGNPLNGMLIYTDKWQMVLYQGGTVGYWGAAWEYFELGTYYADQWIDIEILADYTAKTFTLTVQETTWTDLAFYIPGAPEDNTVSTITIGPTTVIGVTPNRVPSPYAFDDVQISIVGPVIPGDTDGDGDVDADDAAVLASYWQQTGLPFGASRGDFNGDGVANDIDATILAANWTGAGAVAQVPEPSAGLMILLGILSLLGIVRRK